MKVILIDSNLGRHCVEVDASSSIAHIKSCLDKMSLVSPGFFPKLVYHKRILNDQDSLHSIGYAPEDIISVVCVRNTPSPPPLPPQPCPPPRAGNCGSGIHASAEASVLGLSSVEFSILKLRDAFVDVQVVLSRALADLLKRKYGDEPTLTASPGGPVSQARWFVELKHGLSEGMTKWMVAEGPWDMYTLCSSMQTLFTVAIVPGLGLEDAAEDDKRTKLDASIQKVYVTRNWWSHGTGHVTVEECVRAMQAALDILVFLLPQSSISIVEADAVSASVQGHIADVSRACAGANDIHLSMFSQTCLFFMRAMQQLRVAAGGTCDTDLSEAITAMKKKGKLSQNQAFCCEAVLKGRHYIFHGKDTDRVLPLLVSLCSVSTLLRWLGKSGEEKAREEEARACDASVIELMARMGVDDAALLLRHVLEGHADMLKACPYGACLTSDWMRTRHLLWGSVPLACPPCNVTVTDDSIKGSLMQMLRVAKNVPNAAHASLSEACSWLLKSSGLKTLASAAKFDPVPSKEDDMKLLFEAVRQMVEPCCSNTQVLERDISGANICGWALLKHLLPLLPAQKNGEDCIQEAECSCAITFHPSMCIFDENSDEANAARSSDERDTKGSLIWHIKENILLHHKRRPAAAILEVGTAAEASPVTLVALCALASCSLHDSVKKLSACQVEIFRSSSDAGFGLRAAVQLDANFIGREEELHAVRSTAVSVFDGVSPLARRVVLLQGEPGLGKSLVATQALRHVQNDYVQKECSRGVHVEIIRGRGAGVVEDDMLALGRNMGGEIGVTQTSPQDIVFAALRQFFSCSRYVFLIDDADAEGLACALKLLPLNEQRSALIITTQSLSLDTATQLLVAAGDRNHIHVHKLMQPFTPDECMRLMRQLCPESTHGCMYLPELQEQLRYVLGNGMDGLGHLPLAVRLFAHWAKAQFLRNMQPYASDMKKAAEAFCQAAKNEARKFKTLYVEDDVLAAFKAHYESVHHYGANAARALLLQWKSEIDKVVFDADAKYSRGLLGTVRLALFHMEALPSNLKVPCEQLLGLLALCPPVNVPWSLFDGGTKGEAALFVRGATVELIGFDGLTARVVKTHDDGTVHVVFGCDSGELSELKPCAAVQRVDASILRMRGAAGVHIYLQDPAQLRVVADALMKSGLVQVDGTRRMFGMHQLLQKAVGKQLGWECERMQALLHARCGQFGDEPEFDVRLYSIMREVLGAAVAAVGRVRCEGGGQGGQAWCSGMLLRLYEVAREVHGAETEVPERVLAAAHGSLVADLVRAHVMREGCWSGNERMTLGGIVDAVPYIRDVIARDPEFEPDEEDRRAVEEEFSLGASNDAAWATVIVRRFNLLKCLASHWGSREQARLVAHLVRAQVMQEGCTSFEGKTLPIQAVAAVPLIKDVLGLGNTSERDLVQLLKDGCGLRVVDGCGGSSVQAQEVDAAREGDGDGVMGGLDYRLRAMRWRLHTLRGTEESSRKLMHEIGRVYDGEGEGNANWEVGVAFGAACHTIGVRYAEPDCSELQMFSFKSALRLRLSTLGEQHPTTAATLSAIGATFCNTGNHVAAIKFQERAQRIFQDTLGQHPLTARSMSIIAASYGEQVNPKPLKAIELFEQALRIYERTVGRMHRDAAETIASMSTVYFRLGDLVKATELGQESVGIFTKTLGHEHTTTAIARENLGRLLSAASHRPVPVPVTRAKVDELLAMGFSEGAAAEALALKNGDINHATDFLLNCGDAVLR